MSGAASLRVAHVGYFTVRQADAHAIAVAAGAFAWRLNRRLTRMHNRTARVTFRILLNALAAIVILLLLLFALTSGG